MVILDSGLLFWATCICLPAGSLTERSDVSAANADNALTRT